MASTYRTATRTSEHLLCLAEGSLVLQPHLVILSALPLAVAVTCSFLMAVPPS